MEGGNAYLPREIIVNILKRLPVKSLIRFQSVCKNWKNLLNDPLFIADHLHYSHHRPSFLFKQLYQRNDPLYLCSFDRNFRLREVHNPPVIDHYLSSFENFSNVRIIGSSNGLLCVELRDHYMSSHKLLVWNPAIKEAREVPRTTYCKSLVSIGFGFSTIANDYKIINISFFGSYLDPKRGSYWVYKRGVNEVLVYSLGTGLWKRVEHGNTLKDLRIYCEAVTGNNGSIIWLAQNDDGDMIVSFDIAMEVFTLIPMPALHPGSASIPTFYEDKPAFLSHKETGNSKSGFIHLWVVEENTLCASGGGRWIWTKKYSSGPNLYPDYLVPLNIWRNEIICTAGLHRQFYWKTEKYGEALKDRGRILYLLNLTTSEIKNFFMNNFICGSGILNYVESLVPVGNIHI